MNTVTHILSGFETIGLHETEKAKLMDRTDSRFTLSAALLLQLLEKLKPHYKVLAINGNLLSSYKTLYFDTADFKLYLRHHNGGLNRYKIRYRQYVESNSAFLEVKFRSNRQRVLKERMRVTEMPLSWSTESLDFLKARTPYDPVTLQPAVCVSYQRITLVGRQLNERVTLDMNLEFLAGIQKRSISQVIIAELKQPERLRTPALAALRDLRAKDGAMSKYCLGVTQLYAHVKKNNFKEKLNTLNKIIHDTPFSAVAG